MNDALRQIDAFRTPGTVLRAARESRGLTQREAADQLHLMPDYVAILERDDYEALRSPGFARGYLKAYARLVDVPEADIMSLFEQQLAGQPLEQARGVRARPLPLQRTGAGVLIGLVVLSLLVLLLWLWQGREGRLTGASDPVTIDMPAISETGERDET